MPLKLISMDYKFAFSTSWPQKKRFPSSEQPLLCPTLSLSLSLSLSLTHSLPCMHTHFVPHSQFTLYHTQCSTHAGDFVTSWLISLKIYLNLCGKCLVQIPPRTLLVLTEVYFGCSQFFYANATISVVPPLGHDFFLWTPSILLLPITLPVSAMLPEVVAAL
jgi:hypothetical protein